MASLPFHQESLDVSRKSNVTSPMDDFFSSWHSFNWTMGDLFQSSLEGSLWDAKTAAESISSRLCLREVYHQPPTIILRVVFSFQ